MDELTCELIALARATRDGLRTEKSDKLIMEGLFITLTNVDFDIDRIEKMKAEVEAEKNKINASEPVMDASELFHGDTDVISLRSTLLFGLRGMASYAHHARVLGKANDEVTGWLYKGLAAIPENHTVDEWLGLVMELGQANLKCMALLDEANTDTYGTPVPTKVTCNIEKGPFIVITGHDLRDLYQLLEQTMGKGVNVYTHGEMLPAHAYPELHKYPQLKGNFGTAWQNQKREFDGIPAPILYTTNCILEPKPSYADRVFTTSVVGYPGIKHIPEATDGVKDFSPLIQKAIELGGYPQEKKMTGINGGDTLQTGFGRGAVLAVADTVIGAIKSGAIKHIFLVGGCDGAKPGRNYYTEFVKQAPKDTVILTLACGKYRFNDIDAGEIGGLPRIMDMGQCNDAYSAIEVAVALSNAFGCGVNDLPLTLVLSWFEQKAVCILITLLSLGIKNIYLGPSLPAFLSKNVLDVLISKFDLKPITTPEADLKAILG
jgi:hydroxylamine reductase